MKKSKFSEEQIAYALRRALDRSHVDCMIQSAGMSWSAAVAALERLGG